jgi:hypothetical protein
MSAYALLALMLALAAVGGIYVGRMRRSIR